MKRVPLIVFCLLLSAPLFAASKPLTPGVYTVQPCPPPVVCPPLVTCPKVAPCPTWVEPCPTCPPSPVTATDAAPPVCLQPVQPFAGDTDFRLGAADPVATPATTARPWYKRPSFWWGVGGGIVLGVIIEHQYDSDSSSYDHHEGRHQQDDPEPYCFPPGHCRD